MTIINAISACWAWIGVVAHLYCIVKLRGSTARFARTWVWMSASSAGVAFCYAVAYTWLVVGDPDRAAWSEMLAYVALIGWPGVFVLPAAMVITTLRYRGA